MQPAEKLQPNGPVAADSPSQPEAESHNPQIAADPQTPLLAQEQVAKLQKILRSMDHGQLQSVLSAIEPNVMRLCLHAIFGPQNAEEAASPPQPQIQKEPGSGLSAQAEPSNISVQGRQSPRKSTQHNAKISCPSEGLTFDCLILDTSKTGALIFLDHADEVPDIFDLYDIDGHQSNEDYTHLPHKKCKAVWRKRNKMGVSFIG